jgi:hypothetical protein
MRIFIDAIPLLVRSAGVKNYLFHWIVHLRRLLGDEQVRLFPFWTGCRIWIMKAPSRIRPARSPARRCCLR